MLAAFVGTVLFSLILAGVTLEPSAASAGVVHSYTRPGASISLYLDGASVREAAKQLGGNVLLGLPFGVLLPVLIPQARGLVRVAAVTAVVMTLVELIQGSLVTGRAFDVDDVLLNVTGALLGYLVLGRRNGSRRPPVPPQLVSPPDPPRRPRPCPRFRRVHAAGRADRRRPRTQVMRRHRRHPGGRRPVLRGCAVQVARCGETPGNGAPPRAGADHGVRGGRRPTRGSGSPRAAYATVTPRTKGITVAEKEHRKPSPPSEAPGESGDRAARREAEDALVPGDGDGEVGDALSPSTAAQRRTAEQGGDGHGTGKKPTR
ncbi:VanZ family protein [Streptomyces sp. NPDC054975]